MAVADDVTNTIFVSAQSANSGSVDDSDTAVVDVIHPAVSISQTPTVVEAGTNVTVTLIISNAGDVDLTTVSVTADACDAFLSSSPINDANSDGTLSVGETWNYTCVKAAVTSAFTNNVSVTALDPINLSVEQSLSLVTLLNEISIYLPTIVK